MIRTLQDLIELFPARGEVVYSRMYNGEIFAQTTYRQVYDAARKVTAYLQNSLQLKKGDFVLLSSENRPQWMMGYLGAASNGLVGVPLDVLLSADEAHALIADCGASTMMASGPVFQKLRQNKNIMEKVRHWLLFDPVDSPPANAVFLGDILAAPLPAYTVADISPEDTASLIYTSGTTGFAKAVLLTHKNFAHQCNNLTQMARMTPADVIMSLLPLHHTFMFSVETAVMYCGAGITHVESLKPARILAAVKETGITIMIAIPMLYKKILEGIQNKLAALPGFGGVLIRLLYQVSLLGHRLTGGYGVGKVLFRSLREKAGFGTTHYLISGAGPLAQKTAEGYAALGFNLANGYGLTEASPICAVNPIEGPTDNKSVGTCPPNTWWRIDSPNGEGIGEICVRGDNIMKGYYKNPEATAQAVDSEGWLHTGDMGYIAPFKGVDHLYITGRLKNIIVTGGGKNIYPEELEELINAHPHILESVVIGVPGGEDDAGEKPCALVVLNLPLLEELGISEAAAKAEIETHIRSVNKQLKSYQVIRGWEIRTEELQKNTTRKVKRFEYLGKDYTYLLK